MPARELARGFREFRAAMGECRFADCLHAHEPDCGVKARVARGDISQNRYESYLRLLHLMDSLA